VAGPGNLKIQSIEIKHYGKTIKNNKLRIRSDVGLYQRRRGVKSGPAASNIAYRWNLEPTFIDMVEG
jgi:hypothetical protein